MAAPFSGGGSGGGSGRPSSAAPTSGPIRRRTRRPRAEREAEILASARDVFAERGYGAAAVAEIATRAGVVEGTVYSYFDSKRALLIAVMTGFYEELIAGTERGLRAVSGTENRLRFVIRRHLDLFAGNRADLGLCRVVIREARSDIALYDEAILSLNRRYTGLAVRILEEGIASGDLRPEVVPSVVRDLIYGGIEHAVWRLVYTDVEIDAGQLASQLSDAVLLGISARPEPISDPVSRLERAVERLESSIRIEEPNTATEGSRLRDTSMPVPEQRPSPSVSPKESPSK